MTPTGATTARPEEDHAPLRAGRPSSGTGPGCPYDAGMDETTAWLTLGGTVFLVIALLGGTWQWRRDTRRRAGSYERRYGGDPDRLLAQVGPDERDALRRVRRLQGDEAAAMRMRRVDRSLPFEAFLAAVRRLDDVA